LLFLSFQHASGINGNAIIHQSTNPSIQHLEGNCISRPLDKDWGVMESKDFHVLVLGAGFGGLAFCHHFRHPKARVTIVDRTNHHLFQPLLYQVAAAGLAAPDIAQPIRSILARHPRITVLLAHVQDINLSTRQVMLQHETLTYDYLVLALGGCTSYFGHPEWEQFAPGLKTLADALEIRSHVLLAFEKAENTSDPAERERLMTLVIVGGGPTGLELAGAFAELARTVLKRDFRRIDPSQARIILIEAAPSVLSNFPTDLSASAARQLSQLGVHVRVSTKVKTIREKEVELENGEVLRAENILWAAGVSAVPLTKRLGVDLDRAGRVKVNPDLSLPGHPEVFAVGDLALVLDENGKPVPGVSPAAMQMARHVVRIIGDELDLGPGRAPRPPFKYWDKGTMATIGRSAAVAWIGKLHFSGFLAWLAWLLIHLIFLVGFRNRLAVLIQWTYSYLTYKRSARIIIGLPPEARNGIDSGTRSTICINPDKSSV
jgi:NADH dehydrogenase